MQYYIFHFSNEKYLSDIIVYTGKLMKCTIQAKCNIFLNLRYHRGTNPNVGI